MSRDEARGRGLAWDLAAALAAALLLLGIQAAEPYFFLRDDNATHFLPAYVYAYESVALHHEIPFLDQHQSLGATFLAPGQTGVLYPPLYPAAALTRALLGDDRGLIDVLASLHLALAAVGMGRLLRRLAIAPLPALLLALAFGLLPFGLLAGRNWIVVTYAMAYLPWNLLLLLRLLERPGARRGLALVAVKALFVVSGYLHYLILASLAELVFLLAHAARRGDLRFGSAALRREGMALAAVHSLVGLLAAPLLLPMWAAKGISQFRQARWPLEAAIVERMEPEDFLRAQVFAPRGEAIFEATSALFFLGLPLLAALLFWHRRYRREEPALAASLAAGLFALAISTTLWAALWCLPLLSALRGPFKAFPIAAFFLTLAAARGFQLAGERFPAFTRWLAPLLALQLAAQLFIATHPPWNRSFGPERLATSVAELRADPLLSRIGTEARVASLAHRDDPDFEAEPRQLGFLFATLTGKYQLAGYDPLVAELNHRLSLEAYHHGTLTWPAGDWDRLFALLRERSVGYLLADTRSAILPALRAYPELRRLGEENGIALFALPGAWPIAYLAADRQPLAFDWRINGVIVHLPPGFSGGQVRITVAALPGYRLLIDGVDSGEPDGAGGLVSFAAPAGAREIELRYVDRGFRRGLLLAVLGLLLAGGWLLVEKLAAQRGRRQTPSTDLPKA